MYLCERVPFVSGFMIKNALGMPMMGMSKEYMIWAACSIQVLLMYELGPNLNKCSHM